MPGPEVIVVAAGHAALAAAVSAREQSARRVVVPDAEPQIPGFLRDVGAVSGCLAGTNAAGEEPPP
jgi:succinate dehydrogenase/fumarate reductase flavoprotein subunit